MIAYECGHVPLIAAADIEGQMVRYAHAWLIGLLHHLDLPFVQRTSAGRPAECEVDARRSDEAHCR